jgi:hypothetical protein
MSAFSSLVVADFVARMEDYLRSEQPERCAALDQAALRRHIHSALESGAGHGMTSEQAACVYIEASLVFGADLADLGGACEVLATARSIEARVDRLLAALDG